MSTPHTQRDLLINSVREANALLNPTANATPEQFYDAVIYLLGQVMFKRVGVGILQKVYDAGLFRRSDDVLVTADGDEWMTLTNDEIVFMQYVEDRAMK